MQLFGTKRDPKHNITKVICSMGSPKVLLAITGLAVLLSGHTSMAAGVDCNTVTAFISACSSFIVHGFPDPYPESPCCVAITSLNNLSSSPEDRREICRCFMGMIATYNSNATAIATVPGFCGVSLGFGIDANTDCEYIVRLGSISRRSKRVDKEDSYGTKTNIYS